MEASNDRSNRSSGGAPVSRSRPGRSLLKAGTALGAILVALGLGCNGGGGGGNSVTPCASISFTSSITNLSAGDVYLLSRSSSCDQVDVSVMVRNLSGIFTVGFEITYPSAILAFPATQGFTAGPLLYQGNPPIAPLFIVNNASPGGLVVSGTLFRPDGSVTASGDAMFITLHFVKVASGTDTVDFNLGSGGNQIIDDNGNAVSASFGPGHGGVVQVP